jgi:hypothetical protein
MKMTVERTRDQLQKYGCVFRKLIDKCVKVLCTRVARYYNWQIKNGF